jgi:hypothetical protein
MRTLAALAVAGAICLVWCQSADAVPAAAAAMKRAVTDASTVQQAQYYALRTRHGIVKCYRELVVGPCVCHRFHRWWW